MEYLFFITEETISKTKI